ncbi:Major Facilitator Superfamily (MFS) [Achlya hypogyna]|uniref:Major Facilitator Superfamily (MFS) n=1 Tax=Achlya hypogyna TaxID=1202772 RepID=A0A1V9Y549_ACHHY|nr:Major Facilitator Superfamily (MFS) [Achlya hypogyna]
MSIATAISVLIGAFVVAGALLDVEFNQTSKRLFPRHFRWRRLANWFPLGIAYAAFYMARYNIAAGNIESIRSQLHMTATDMGWIISSGSWAYAISAPLTGAITDRLGGQQGMLIACVGAGLCNLVLALLFTNNTFTQFEFMLFYASNVLFQGFGTSAVVKINAMWYAPSERGLFSGIFNILIVSGYYLALGSGDYIVSNLGWPYLFYIPSAIMLSMAVFILAFIRNKPPSDEIVVNPVSLPLCPTGGPGQSSFARLLQNKTVWGYLGAVFCLSWARDGLLNWMYSYFDAVRAVPLSPNDHALLGGAWTLGGFVGGVLCGWISDAIFHGKRMPPIVLFSFMQGILFVALYAFGSSVSIEVLAGILFCVSVFLLGNYTLLSYTVPTDLPVDIAASAAGLFTAVGYFATGLSGVVMGTFITKFGYTFWIASLSVTSCATAMCTILGSRWAHSDELKEEPLTEKTPLSVKQLRTRSYRASLVRIEAEFFAVPAEDNDHDEDSATP